MQDLRVHQEDWCFLEICSVVFPYFKSSFTIYEGKIMKTNDNLYSRVFLSSNNTIEQMDVMDFCC